MSTKADKIKPVESTKNIQNIRACNILLVPINQLENISKVGCYIPVVKQGVSSETPHLTDREYECLKHYVDGYNTKSIAQKMGLSNRRVQNIMETLRRKFAVNTDHWLVSKYYQLGMDAL